MVIIIIINNSTNAIKVLPPFKVYSSLLLNS